MTIVPGVTARVPAKLNLQLAVGPRRADGYHGLVTVFHAVSLFDEVTAEAAGQDGVTVTGEGADRVPSDQDNLALRAVAALRTAVGGAVRAAGVHVTIAKRIPVAAGLAGGSADAAGALVACNELWRSGLTQRQLGTVAAKVGSDVAFALLGGTAVGRGRGERLTPALAPATPYHWVLAFADGQLSTPEVYAALDRLRAAAKGARGERGDGQSPRAGARGDRGDGQSPRAGGLRGVGPREKTLRTARKELQRLERQLDRLSAREDELAAELAANASDYARLTSLGAELRVVQAEKSDLEDRWLTVAAALDA